MSGVRDQVVVTRTDAVPVDRYRNLADEAVLADDVTTRLTTTTGSTYTVTEDDHLIVCDTTSTAVTVTLPLAGAVDQREYIIKNNGGANDVTLAMSGSEKLDGSAATLAITPLESYTVRSDGGQWWIASSNDAGAGRAPTPATGGDSFMEWAGI